MVYSGVKAAKPDALVITQTPHPSFVDVADMIRLNDMLRLDDVGGAGRPVVPQMRRRAAVARAACPELLIDTDDWTIPDKRTWREYAEAKLELGVPSLYYATRLDLSGEELDEDDYALLRRTWGRVEERTMSASRHPHGRPPTLSDLAREAGTSARPRRARSAGAVTSRATCGRSCSTPRSGSATCRTCPRER